jgi:hypothetical protein
MLEPCWSLMNSIDKPSPQHQKFQTGNLGKEVIFKYLCLSPSQRNWCGFAGAKIFPHVKSSRKLYYHKMPYGETHVTPIDYPLDHFSDRDCQPAAGSLRSTCRADRRRAAKPEATRARLPSQYK